MKRLDPGFTLLEVLAAVALLGILYTTLVGVAIQGLRSEGVSQRRLEASLLADRYISELELEMESGDVPAEGVDEEEEDPFVITITVEAYEIPRAADDDSDDSTSVLATLQQLSPSAAAPVRRIHVSVAWHETSFEYSVERTTFGFDLLAVDALVKANGGLPTTAPSSRSGLGQGAGSGAGQRPGQGGGGPGPPAGAQGQQGLGGQAP